MSIEDFVRAFDDLSYRRYIWDKASTGKLDESEELLLLNLALGPSHRKWANTERTQPWPTVLHQMYHEYRARSGYVEPRTRIEHTAEAWEIRHVAQRRLVDPRFADLRGQLQEIIWALDETFEGEVRGVERR
jgi:hypothetical protein